MGLRENISGLTPVYGLTWTHNLSVWPDLEMNPQPFSVWYDAPTTEQHSQGQRQFLYDCIMAVLIHWMNSYIVVVYNGRIG